MTESAESEALPAEVRAKVGVLLVSILLIALCGITYELIVATVSSYFLGNSIFEFSLTIGIFMSAMGIGSWASRLFTRRLLERFLMVELLIGLIGGLSGPVLFAVFALESDLFRLAQVLVSVAIGVLIGLEIPLITRYLRNFSELRVALANVLSWDYIGALAGSLAFPLILLPQLGLIGTSLSVGLVNLGVATTAVVVMRRDLEQPRIYIAGCLTVGVALLVMLFGADRIERYVDRQLYQDQIIYSEQSAYQKIVVTRWRDDVRLYINGNIQFSSADEYRYHEALVHIPMAMARERDRVLILGGGDGMGVREVFRWAGVDAVTLVDLDPAMTRIGRELPPVVALNEDALADPRVTVANADAMTWLQDWDGEPFDVIIVDLPDPNHAALAKLYSRSFYRLARARLADGGVFVTQSTSPYFARRAFWSIHRTMEVGFCPPGAADADARTCAEAGHVLAYHANVPNFGDWGFNVAAKGPLPDPSTVEIPFETLYLHDALIPTLFVFPKDQDELEVEINRLLDPVLLHYYLDDWTQWNL